MKKFYVYVHTCPNGKRYVGCTKQARPELRWKEGRGYQFNTHFYQAVVKYGWDNIKHEFWELTCESEMYYAEKYLIAYYNTTDNKFGYNHRTGGMEGSKKTGPRKPISEETREKLKNASFHKDPEYKKKLSEANRKRWLDPEYRRKMSEALKDKPLSEEHRKHCAEANRRTANDPERVRKIVEAAKKRAKDPEFRKKMSEVHKKKWLDPEFKERMSKVRSDPEVRKRLSEAAKNRPRIKIKLPDGTVLEITKPNLVKCYINKGKSFEYVS